MPGARALAMVLLLWTAFATPAGAETAPPTGAIDAMLECERADGGWMYVCPPEHGFLGVTKVVNTAARVSSGLGLEPWDLVVLRSPGTPAAGLLLIEAYERTGKPEYLEAARRNGDLLVNLQLRSGGWFSEMPVHGNQLATWFRLIVPWATLDDDVTPGSVRFLLALWKTTGDERYRDAAERGLELLVDSQLPSGAWPLTWRPAFLRWLSPSFEDLPSLNDAATASVIQTLVMGAQTLDRPDLLAAAERGGDWLSQTLSASTVKGWSQQYDETGHPVPGRAFEPIALATWESKHAVQALIDLARATGNERYCRAAEQAIEWLARSAMSPGCWARFYSFETAAPIFLDDHGDPVASAEEAKRPYRWKGDYGIPALFAELGLDASGHALPAGAPSPAVLPRIAGDAGECPISPRRRASRRVTRNPRARIGEAGTQMTLSHGTLPPPCRLDALRADAQGSE